MNNTTKQKHEQNADTKQVWVAPLLETCNMEQTMASTNSGSDGGSPTA